MMTANSNKNEKCSEPNSNIKWKGMIKNKYHWADFSDTEKIPNHKLCLCGATEKKAERKREIVEQIWLG